MAGPNLPVNVDAAYADSATDPSQKIHQQHHDTVGRMLNRFDDSGPATDGQILKAVNGLWMAADQSVSQSQTAKRTITAAYTVVLADATDIVLHSTAASAVTITLPTDATAAIPQEVPIPWRQYGAGLVTFAAATGATLLSRGSVFRSAGQYAGGLLTKVAANTWLLEGDIAA